MSENPVFETRNGRAYAYGELLDPVLPIEVYFYQQDQRPNPKPDRLAAKGLKLTPIRYRDEQGLVGQPSSKGDARTLTYAQFAALYAAVGAESGWWPLEDPTFNVREFFQPTEMYLLSDGDKPIGFGCIKHDLSSDGAADMVYVGVIPSQQGKGYGSALFDAINNLCWDKNPNAVRLKTVPAFDHMSSNSGEKALAAAQMYEKHGFTLSRIQICLPEPDNLHTLNMPQFYEREAEIMARTKLPEGLNYHEARLMRAFRHQVTEVQ